MPLALWNKMHFPRVRAPSQPVCTICIWICCLIALDMNSRPFSDHPPPPHPPLHFLPVTSSYYRSGYESLIYVLAPHTAPKCTAKCPHSIESLVKNLCQQLQCRTKPALGGQKDPIPGYRVRTCSSTHSCRYTDHQKTVCVRTQVCKVPSA